MYWHSHTEWRLEIDYMRDMSLEKMSMESRRRTFSYQPYGASERVMLAASTSTLRASMRRLSSASYLYSRGTLQSDRRGSL